MGYENVYQVESFLVDGNEEKYVNELIKSGWKLISVIQYKDDYDAYGKYVLGADEEAFQKNNIEMIRKKETKRNQFPF